MRNIPVFAAKVVGEIEKSGHAAYLVGGCVRDMALQRQPADWDVCTSATAEEVEAIFPHTVPTGARFGTVTVLTEGGQVEVTTFREDGAYQDARRPETVSFSTRLEDDLKRRDFTINAMAMDLNGEIIDLYGGLEDISARCIRCVGDPDTRFREDALRMLRGLRFSAQLGFSVESRTMESIRRNAPGAARLSAERIRDEVEKMLLSDRPEILDIVVKTGLLDGFILCRSVDFHTLKVIKNLPPAPALRWAAFCLALSSAGAVTDSEALLIKLRLDKRTAAEAGRGAARAFEGVEENEISLKRLIGAAGKEAAQIAAELSDLTAGGHRGETVREILESGDCYTVSQLAIGGKELLAAGYSGAAVGEKLAELLEHVIRHPEDNCPEKLRRRI